MKKCGLKKTSQNKDFLISRICKYKKKVIQKFIFSK